jgi:hypothetical protein
MKERKTKNETQICEEKWRKMNGSKKERPKNKK